MLSLLLTQCLGAAGLAVDVDVGVDVVVVDVDVDVDVDGDVRVDDKRTL